MRESLTARAADAMPDSFDLQEHLRETGEDGYAALVCKKVRDIVSLIKFDTDRDFSRNPLSVEEIAELLAADSDFPLRPAHDYPFKLDTLTGQFVPDEERVYWAGDSDEARRLNAYLAVVTYWSGEDF